MSAINQITRDNVRMFKDLLSDQFHGNTNVLDVYQRIATKSAIYPGQGTALGVAYVALKGSGEAGEFAEHTGKAMRDDALIEMIDLPDGRKAFVPGELTPERRELLIKEVGDQLWYLAAKCNELGITLSAAALANLEKLLDRTERDALRGSGDQR